MPVPTRERRIIYRTDQELFRIIEINIKEINVRRQQDKTRQQEKVKNKNKSDKDNKEKKNKKGKFNK